MTSQQPQRPPPRPLAIVGCGQIVTHHCAALAALPPGTFRVVALCDLSAGRRAVISSQLQEAASAHVLAAGGGEGGAATDVEAKAPAEFNTLDELLADEGMMVTKPAVFISVPHDVHVPLATQALAAGLDVIMEKPLAPTLAGCRDLLAAADRSEGMFIISEQSPYWEEVAKAKELLRKGEIGSLTSAASYYYESMRDNTTSGLDEAGGLGWRASLERAGGGIVMDGGLHWLRPLREFCGECRQVVGVCKNVDKGLGQEGETLAHALLKMDKGDGEEVVATFSANMTHRAVMAHDTCPYFRLTGSGGEMVIYGTGLDPDGGGGLKLYNEDNPRGTDLFPKDRQGGFFLGFRGVWGVVSEILASGDRQRARETVRSAAADVGVAKALYTSSETGGWVDCESFQG